MKKPNREVEVLIEKLHEQYQQIFSYSKYDSLASRKCDSRLRKILDVYNQIKKQLERELKVLDLGCAQGYFSLNLAKEGAFVSGVDCNQENINLCNKLSNIHNLSNVEFKKDKIQNFLKNNPLHEYDLVLGLSVFHHICHEEGYEFTKSLIKKTAEVIPNGIYELALSSEPMYWAKSLNENEKEIVKCYSYINQISSTETHLSNIKRPIYFASNKLFLMESFAKSYDIAFTSSHDFEDNAHNETRRYFISNAIIIKYLSFKNKENRFQNQNEYENEVNFLENKIALRNKPKLLYKFYNNEYGVIARELISGELLYKVINKLSFEAKKRITMDIISQLVILEKSNLYHNDLRVWNIIVDKNKEVSLIDYGSITNSSKDCVWPSNVYHSFIVLVIEIFSEDYTHNNPTRKLDLTKLHTLRELQHAATKTLLEKPDNLNFKLIHKCFLECCPGSKAPNLHPLIYEQNQSLILHIRKLFQVKYILNDILFTKNKHNLQIDSLLRNIQDLFFNKNNYIIWLEKAKTETSTKNQDLKKIAEGNEQQIKSLSDQIKRIIIENNKLLQKYDNLSVEKDKLSQKYDSLSVEKNNLSQKYDDLSFEKRQLQEELNYFSNLTSNLNDKLYKAQFTKHLYRAWKRISGAKKYKS